MQQSMRMESGGKLPPELQEQRFRGLEAVRDTRKERGRKKPRQGETMTRITSANAPQLTDHLLSLEVKLGD